jgi:hypothetical protein
MNNRVQARCHAYESGIVGVHIREIPSSLNAVFMASTLSKHSSACPS